MKKCNATFRSLFFLLLFSLCCLGCAKTVSASSVSQNGQLQVKGSQIVNKNGKAFVIKGISTHGLSWYPQYVNKKAFQSLKNRGVNTIRLAMYTEEYNGYCTGNAANRKKLENLIDKGVSYATDLGMYVIIDWHILSDGNPLKHKSAANAFFKKTAKKYANHNNVLYEICNEPNGLNASWKNIRRYANSVIKTIRSIDKKAIIIVGTPVWSQELLQAADKPISGKNIVYAFHFYASTHTDDMRKTLKTAIKRKLPVIVSEFGLSEASGTGNVDLKQAAKWMNLLNHYKIGRVCWSLSNKDETSALIKASCNKVSDWLDSDLTKAGKWLFQHY